ncbi:HAMP domain-containing sensor histidine kinase [Clostridiaceae bacterium M8S5]|nr:HAMP domain-containing sensor histidine kinase [Clostridiaceae bacterium M8S5]
MRGIKKRWLRTYLLIPIVILMCFEVGFVILIKNYYHGYVKSEIVKNLEVTITIYNKFLAKRSVSFKNAIDELYNDDHTENNIEIQIVDRLGELIYTSNKTNINLKIKSKDFLQALQGKTGYEIMDYYSKEKVMIVSKPLYFNDRVEGVIRGVVSLEKANKAIMAIIEISIVICIMILLIMILLSTIFSKSIINPIREISRVSKLYALGDFTERINKQYGDEIGELTDSINNMASEIKKAQEIKNQFIASISHELRTPLTAIKGWSETLLENDTTKDDMMAGLNIINTETLRLTRLVEELLDFSRIERKELELKLTTVDIGILINDVAHLFEQRSNKESIIINIKEYEQDMKILGDYNRLKQVLINVIDNSFKFNKNEGYINITVSKEDEYAIIEIEDSGIGIAKNQLKKVTDKFYKGSEDTSGSGLGLAISKEIIELHKGVFKISSNIGKGTKVIIRLNLIDTK